MGSFEPLIAPIADDHLRAKGAVRHEPCARLVARMFTFWAKKIAYCIVRNDRDCRCASNSASDWNCAGPGSDRFRRAGYPRRLFSISAVVSAVGSSGLILGREFVGSNWIFPMHSREG